MTPSPSNPVVVVSGPGGVGKSTIAHRVAAAFDRSVHLKADDLMASIVSGRVDPGSPDAAEQHRAIGGALAVSAMCLADDGYAAVVDGYFFPEGVARLAEACTMRALTCHYVVLAADLGTCLDRATARGGGHPLREAIAEVHARFAQLDLDGRHVIDASREPEATAAAVLVALDEGSLRW